MKSEMKNNDMYSKKIWSSAIQLVLLSLILLFSQLTLAKDRIQYHIQNFDGSTLKVINEQGIVSQSYQYAPFGQQLQLKKPSNLKNPQAFVGGVQDANDLVYLKQRHYNPVLGRFYQPDPVTFISGGHGQINPYQYGWNDSYTFRDSTGKMPVGGTPEEIRYYEQLRIDQGNLPNLQEAKYDFFTLNVLSNFIPVGTSFNIFKESWLTYSSLKFALPEMTFITQAQKATNVVYQGVDKFGDVRYIGITQRAPEVRFAEHLNAFGTGKELLQYRVIDGATNLSRRDARIMEQTLINQYGLGKNGGMLLNQINSISPKYWERFSIR